MTQKPSLKDLLHQDILILLDRFQSYQLDEEERSWHIERYFNNLDLDQPKVISLLTEALHEAIAQQENLGVDASEETNFKLTSLRQFLHATIRMEV